MHAGRHKLRADEANAAFSHLGLAETVPAIKFLGHLDSGSLAHRLLYRGKTN